MQFPYRAEVHSEIETEQIAKKFSDELKGGEVISLVGELGAGKTFFIKKALSNFGISWVNSPSFAIVNEYRNSFKFYHIDFYRVKSARELFDIGIYDYLNDKESIAFIEWGNLFANILPKERIEIQIKIVSNHSREIAIEKYK